MKELGNVNLLAYDAFLLSHNKCLSIVFSPLSVTKDVFYILKDHYDKKYFFEYEDDYDSLEILFRYRNPESLDLFYKIVDEVNHRLTNLQSITIDIDHELDLSLLFNRNEKLKKLTIVNDPYESIFRLINEGYFINVSKLAATRNMLNAYNRKLLQNVTSLTLLNDNNWVCSDIKDIGGYIPMLKALIFDTDNTSILPEINGDNFPNLQELTLCSYEIEKVPEGIYTLKNLKHLDITKTQISKDTFELCKEIDSKMNLESFKVPPIIYG